MTVKNLKSDLLQEWKFWCFGAIFSFIFASILMSGWPEGLIPNLSYPYVRGGDSGFTDWGVQRLIEGWVFNNPRSGYPFGSNFLDYPNSDAAGFLILKIIGMVTGKYYAATNLFFLLSFPAIVIASFFCLRAFKLNSWLSLSASIVFAFSSFHFLRIGHIFYTWYFVVPLFFYIANKVFYFDKELTFKNRLKSILLPTAGIFTLGSFGVYYALFGIIVIGISGIAGSISTRSYKNFILCIAINAVITAGVIANIAPNIFYGFSEGKNPEAVSRSLYGSELYGFKLVQLILPHQNHHIKSFSEKAAQYNASTPLVNENTSSTLGLLGALGLSLFGVVIAIALSGKKIDNRLGLIALVGSTLFLFGTIGGFGSIFSMFISTSIRGWNRISIFIDFAAIATTFIALQLILQSKFKVFCDKRLTLPLIALSLIAIGIYDQTNWACKSCNQNTQTAFEMENSFIREVESLLPNKSAVYQLPYMQFPEVPPLHRLQAYDHAAGFANSKELLWSYGGMKGRKGDQFFRALSKEPVPKQIEVAQNLGFSAIYIDRRGFADNGNSLVTELTKIAGKPIATRSDGEVLVFRLIPKNDTSIANLNYSEIVDKSGFSINGIQNQYKATLQEGINFKKGGYPDFLQSVSGIDGEEGWGRWSNANLEPAVKIVFNKPLPKRFKLELKAIAYGPNINANTKIQIGNDVKLVKLTADSEKVYQIEFDNVDKSSAIEIFPPNPTSPNDLNSAISDTRKIGIGFISLKIIPTL